MLTVVPFVVETEVFYVHLTSAEYVFANEPQKEKSLVLERLLGNVY